MRYRRVYIEGASYFFTIVTEKRRALFADDNNIKLLRAADWQYSSIHRYIKLGILDKQWGSCGIDIPANLGYE